MHPYPIVPYSKNATSEQYMKNFFFFLSFVVKSFFVVVPKQILNSHLLFFRCSLAMPLPDYGNDVYAFNSTLSIVSARSAATLLQLFNCLYAWRPMHTWPHHTNLKRVSQTIQFNVECCGGWDVCGHRGCILNLQREPLSTCSRIIENIHGCQCVEFNREQISSKDIPRHSPVVPQLSKNSVI